MALMMTDELDQCRRQEEIDAHQRERARAVARSMTENPDRQRVIALMLLVRF